MIALRVASVVALLVDVAVADPRAIAEEEFTRGNTAYNLGRFDDAVGYFTKAYETWPQPELLYNIAQAYRLGGNCKQAAYFYRRFRSLKDKDTAAPLSSTKRKEVDRFIESLGECAAKADSVANVPPQTLDAPTVPPPRTAAVDPDNTDDNDNESPEIAASTTSTSTPVIAARLEMGIALLGAGSDTDIPIQPVLAVNGGYPLALDAVTLEVGARVSYSPLPYEAMGAQKQGALLGVHARAAVRYALASRLYLHAELGVGVASLTGLDQGNPISDDRAERSFTLFNARAGVAVELAITENLAAVMQPFAIAYSPGSDAMFADSLREIDLLVGVGYRR